MAGGDCRKCKCCLKLFRPDPRNRHHQRYCSVPACRAASKAASQARWLAAAENQGYFRGPVNVARVQAWRSCHPGYWRKRCRAGTALQDVSMAQPIRCRNSQSGAVTVTRGLNGATCCSDWLNRPYRGDAVTR